MNTSYPRKLADLTLALAASPRDVWPYLTHLPCWGRQPVDVELPWISYPAIRLLESHLRPHHRVFEFGSGGSTFFFARRSASVLAMESHAPWQARVTDLARSRQLANVTCELHPLDDGQMEGYRDSPFFHRVASHQWDVIMIDCFCGCADGTYGQLRRHALELSLSQLAPGGLIVLDDSWLFPDLLVPRPGWVIRDLVGPGPCRYGVTSTAIFQRTTL